MQATLRSEGMRGLRSLLALSGKYLDIALAAAVVALVVVMVVPIPPLLLDVLLAASFTGAVTLLALAMLARDPLTVTVFPALLLLSTLMRLTLNISSTRLILSDAYAGEVIASFGEFVVAGSVVVGAAIFTLLTAVQYVVVARGSERVAEVSARFALDATPGRQMSIEADLRAGIIDAPAAARRREALRREGHLYGAMDGAMKFVKGDAIAGMLIILVNIGAGLAIGVTQKGMTLAAAVSTYTLLTVGDGLVTQLPSLMVSVAAGILVTRVAGASGPASFGHDVASEILGRPKALAVGSAMAIALGLLPGLPAGPFLIVGTLLGGVAWTSARVGRRDADRLRLANAPRAAPVPALVRVELAADVLAAIGAWDPDGPLLGDAVPAAREILLAELGLRLPAVELGAAPADAAPGSFVVVMRDIPAVRGSVSTDNAAVVLRDALVQSARAHGRALLGVQEVRRMLDALGQEHPALLSAVVPARVGVAPVAGALRELVAEGVPVNDLAAILEALATGPKPSADPVRLAEQVRRGLAGVVTHRFLGGSRRARVLILAADTEATLADGLRGGRLSLGPELQDDLRDAAAALVREHARGDGALVLLVSAELRRPLYDLLAAVLGKVPVLAREELESDVEMTVAGTLGF